MYGFFVPYFAASFFPVEDRAARILAAFAVFAVGFFFRPLGGAILGSYADRHGRRAGMTLTILLMAGASALIALLPTYGQIGVAAPVLLTLARCVQGFSAGGEFGTSSAFLVENAPPGRRAWAGSFQQVSVGAGTLLASVLASIMFSLSAPRRSWHELGLAASRSASAPCSACSACGCAWPCPTPRPSPAPATLAAWCATR